MGWETMEGGPPESSVGGRRRRFKLPLRGVVNSSIESMTVPDNVVDDREGWGDVSEVVGTLAPNAKTLFDFLIMPIQRLTPSHHLVTRSTRFRR